MRLILGILIGIGITIGAAYIHDANTATPPSASDGSQTATEVTGRPVVNWDVLGAITHDWSEWVRTEWNKLVH
jgi:hypothetical protein